MQRERMGDYVLPRREHFEKRMLKLQNRGRIRPRRNRLSPNGLGGRPRPPLNPPCKWDSHGVTAYRNTKAVIPL